MTGQETVAFQTATTGIKTPATPSSVAGYATPVRNVELRL